MGQRGSTDPGYFSEISSSFSATWQKTKQKNTPVSRLTLRVAVAAGARGNSPACQRAQTVPALIPAHIADARRGTMGKKKP
jgi:hypothetical protein